MRKLLSVFSLLCVFSAPTVALSGVELAENIKPAQPTKSTYLPSKELLVKRYVLADSTPVSVLDIAQNVTRELGSDSTKKVYIIWTNKASEKSAKQVRDELVKLKVKPKSIQLEHSKMKRDTYPVYVEVRHIGERRFNCKVNTAEDMISFDPYNPCASKSNLHIQLKN